MLSSGSKEKLSLSELIFHADQFCSRVEAALAHSMPDGAEDEELRWQMTQSRSLLGRLQTADRVEALDVNNKIVQGDFRRLIVSLLWIGFHARRLLSPKLFGLLVMIESEFTFLLISRK